MSLLLSIFLAALNQCDSNTTDSIESQRQSAIADMKAGRWTDAKEKLTTILSNRPDDANAFSLRGLCQIEIGNLEGGKNDLNRAVGLDPRDAQAKFGLAKAATYSNDTLTAIQILKAILENHKDYAPVIIPHNIGKLYLRSNNPKDALRYFRIAVERCADVSREDGLLIDYASCLVDLHDYNAAVKILEESTQIAPNDPWAWNYLLWLYKQLGLTAKCDEACQRAYSLFYNDKPKPSGVSLSMPFKGVWMVQRGNGKEDYDGDEHNGLNDRFAWDFVEVNQDFVSCKVPVVDNESYFGFGSALMSSSDGIVVAAVDGIQDNALNRPNNRVNERRGNYVFIKHPTGYFVLYAHLKKHSVRVKAGQVVKRGDVLGQCGNSGRSVNPHLHFSVNDKVNSTVSVPATLSKYKLYCGKGEEVTVTDGIPKRGEMVKGVDGNSE